MKTILITGSGRRLGRNLAELFADSGYTVLIHYNTAKEGADATFEKIKKAGGEAHLFQADLTNEIEVVTMFKRIKDLELNIDVLVNNAAVLPPKKKLVDMNTKYWDGVMDINLRATMLCSREFAKIAEEGAKIINIASLGGQEIWDRRMSYNVSKAALLQLNKGMARDLAPKISVNAVSPGTIFMPEEESDDLVLASEKIPMKRYGMAKEVFEAVQFFAECSNYITAQNINVDGGYHDCR
jgi:NAD(P)-dependent dehydrogenase (short-subunit alcohol dehydrogenase family)